MPPRILIVDDEPDFLDLLRFHLCAAGYDVVAAKDGLEALNKARTATPDLIILDLMMPELDGTAVTEILRRLPSTNQLPILMLTACQMAETREIAKQAGITEYLTKPFSPKDLLRRIRTLLNVPVAFGNPDFPEALNASPFPRTASS